MLPLLGLLYAVALIDRTNLGIAYIAGMQSDLVRKLLHFRCFSNLAQTPHRNSR